MRRILTELGHGGWYPSRPVSSLRGARVRRAVAPTIVVRVGSGECLQGVDDRMLIVGGGRMGEGLLSGLLEAGRPPAELIVAEVSATRRDELAAAYPVVTIVE